MTHRIAIRRWTTMVTLLLLVTTTVGSASAQVCATMCLIFYGRFTVQDGEIYWYSSCTTTIIGDQTHYNCIYKTGPQLYGIT
jgi:hypothetical protein